MTIYLVIFWYPRARSWCACMCGYAHFPGFHLKVSAWDSLFSIPLEILSLFIFKDWTWCVWTQWTVVGGLVLFPHNHLKWLDQATQVIYSFKKYICLINTLPGTLQVSWLSLSSPLGFVVSWQQQDGSSGYSQAGLCHWAKKSVVPLAQVDEPSASAWLGARAWGECCSHGALHVSWLGRGKSKDCKKTSDF